MKKLFVVIHLLSALVFTKAALAGPGDSCHFHSSKNASETVVIKCADQRKETLIKRGKLEKGWSDTKHHSIDLVDGKKGKEWRVIYKNTAASDPTKASLFMFFTPVGNFIAANHSGQ